MMRIILFGATGMIGRGVFLECLADPDVSHVLSIGRRATNVQHLKLALLHESSPARTRPTDRILTCRCDTTLVGRGRSSD